jgi:hypothetical protein
MAMTHSGTDYDLDVTELLDEAATKVSLSICVP